MSVFRGNSGYVNLGTQQCEIAEWRARIEYDRPDITPITSEYSVTGLGLTRGSGSITSYVWLGSTPNTFTITLHATNGKTVTGSAQLTTTELVTPAEGFLTYEYEFIFTGPITVT